MTERLLDIQDLQVVFHTPLGDSQALRGVTYGIDQGEIFGVVGESGCGKSMTARTILGLVPHTGEIVNGRILYQGRDLTQLGQNELRHIRGNRIAMVFQDPRRALNPVFTIHDQLAAAMKYNNIAQDKKILRERSLKLLAEVGLPATDRVLSAYPHTLSGGQQQRAMIAMALSTEPELLIADEPTTALDVTIQAQILDLLYGLRDERDLTIMLITHDMGVVARMCDYVVVMYAGRVVEQGPVRHIFKRTRHPYTQGLLTTLPYPGSRGSELSTIPGSVPGGLESVPGCAFASRCSQVMDRCRERLPQWTAVGSEHYVACFLHEERET